MHITEQESRLANKGSRKSNLVAQRQVEADQASAPAEAQQATQVQQIAAVSVPEAQQSLMEDRAEGWAQEPTEARRAIEGLDVQLQAEAAKSARSLEEEREKAAALAREAPPRETSWPRARSNIVKRSQKNAIAAPLWPANWRRAQCERRDPGGTIEQYCEEGAQLKAAVSVASRNCSGSASDAEALASELAKVRREAEAAAAVSSRKNDEAVQQKQAAEAATAELQQSLQQEQKKTAALMQEAKAAQAMTTSAEPQRRALEEAQARAAALASELAGTRREIETQAAQSQKAVDAATQTEAGGGGHHRGTATIPAAGAKEDRRPDAGSQGRASDDDELPSHSAAPSKRHRRVPQHSRASLREHAARSRPRPRSRKRQSMRPRKQKQAAESTIAELRQSLQQEQKKTAALMQEAKAAQAMTTAAEPQRRALEEAQARAAALASELAGTRREIETQAAQSQKAVDAATQTEAGGGDHHRGTATIPAAGAKEDRRPDAGSQGRASEATAAEPQRRALEEAQARAAALASELAGTRREIETQAAQSQKAVDAATNRSRRRRPPSRNCDNPWSRSKRRPPP